MRCKSCKYWNYSGFDVGTCTGIVGETKVIPQPDTIDKKGNIQKRGKLVRVRSGIIVNAPSIITPEDFYCKNWRKK